ncbi:MAG: UDP-N-acetylmuramoylalanine--D-glutamate ligase [Chloroflexi bacterium RBG_16_68_14]|nr:MAG: UDP-N-acetylmuramoylalanine--D-glutamate ligase [Chloroflexi bacterium RBG_16_68_14]
MTLDREFLVGKRVTVLGLGIEGTDLVRYLASHGATVTVSDAKSPEALSRRIKELDGLPVRFSLGANRIEDAISADMLFVSQGVPLTLPAVQAAREKGVPISSMTHLFLELCPGIVIGITGSSGKTTTTALVGAMLAAAGRKHVVGGNIGMGLLALLDEITPETWVVLEMSHSQLETAGRSPHIACVLNVTPNHLDRYTWEEYLSLKLRILQEQSRQDIAVLNLDDEVSCSFATEAPGQVVWFSARRVPNGAAAAFVRDGAIIWRQGSVDTKLLSVHEIPLRGAHNVANVLAAVAIAGAAGLEASAIARAVREFTPAPHRLELVVSVDGVAYYNDSIATTPERALAGLRSFQEPTVLLLGGREKRLPLEELAREAVGRCRAMVCFGEAGPLLEEALRSAAEASANGPPIERVETLAEAVKAARRYAQAGDVMLLSPACTSYDAYDNFEERGEDFRRMVRRLAAKGGKEPSRSSRRAG